MNYYDARRREDGSGWHYTCMNDGQSWPVGSCRDHGPHETEQQARECYREWLLDNATFDGLAYDTALEPCAVEGCDSHTRRLVGVGFGVPTLYPLCDEHMSRDGLALVLPVPGRIISS